MRILWELFDFDPNKYLNDLVSKERFDEENEVPTLAVNGIFGIESVLDPYSLSKHFKFWIAHTDFYITAERYNLINTSPGVEIFRTISPYRFVISIGKAFNEKEVKELLEKSLGVNEGQDEIIQEIVEELENVDHCIFVTKGGDMRVHTRDEENFDSLLKLYKELSGSGEGRLITNVD